MYRQQALALESAILREQFAKERLAIEVGTVDAFQGREKAPSLSALWKQTRINSDFSMIANVSMWHFLGLGNCSSLWVA